MADGPRASLLTLPLPHSTAVSREPGWRWWPGPAGSSSPQGGPVRGASQALAALKSRAPARTFGPEGGGGAPRSALGAPGGSRCRWGLGPGVPRCSLRGGTTLQLVVLIHWPGGVWVGRPFGRAAP